MQQRQQGISVAAHKRKQYRFLSSLAAGAAHQATTVIAFAQLFIAKDLQRSWVRVATPVDTCLEAQIHRLLVGAINQEAIQQCINVDSRGFCSLHADTPWPTALSALNMALSLGSLSPTTC